MKRTWLDFIALLMCCILLATGYLIGCQAIKDLPLDAGMCIVYQDQRICVKWDGKQKRWVIETELDIEKLDLKDLATKFDLRALREDKKDRIESKK